MSPDKSQRPPKGLPKRLPVHEWLVVVTIIVAFLALAIYTRSCDSSPAGASARSSSSSLVRVSITGAVQFPGDYALEKGASIGDLLALAVPTDTADLRRLKKGSVLRQGRAVVVPERPCITIYITGAIEHPGPLTVVKGTRLCDLERHTGFSPLEEANLAVLSKKRYLKDQEVVHVPVVSAKV